MREILVYDDYEIHKLGAGGGTQYEEVTTEKAIRIDVTDVAKPKGKLIPFGRTTQTQLSGKNLFNILDFSRVYPSGSLESNVEDGVLDMVAIGTQGTQMTQYIVSDLDATKNYTLSFKAKKIVLGEDGDHRLRANIAGSNDGENYTTVKNIDQPNPDVGTEYSLNWTITGYQYYRIYLYNNAATPVTIGERTQYYDIQLEEGDTATDYEEFVGGQASPSPDYPQEIRNVEGRSCRNLFDINSEFEPQSTTYKFNFHQKPNTQYTVSTNCPQSNTANLYVNSTSSLSKAYINSPKTITSDANGDFYILVRILSAQDDPNTFNLYRAVINGEYWIQVEEGSTATPYEPYFEGKRLDFNVCNKNLFDAEKFAKINPAYYHYEDGILYQDASDTRAWANVTADFKIEGGKTYSALIENSSITDIQMVFVDINNNTVRINGLSIYHWYSGTSIALPDEVVAAKIKFNPSQAQTVGKVMIYEGLATETKYTPYEITTILFPLAEGQKLMEGDYLADDGVHHTRKQVTESGTTITLSDAKQNGIYVCNKKISGNLNGQILEFGPAVTNALIEYELAEEVIYPYTEEQAEAYNKLKNLKLYKGVNHIWTETDGLEPNLQLTYKRIKQEGVLQANNMQPLNNLELNNTEEAPEEITTETSEE